MLGQQHAVAEDIAAHVTHADDGEVLTLGVQPQLTEVAHDRLPRTPGGDAHGFVVITRRPARGKGIVQPETVVAGHPVGDVGEGGCALVGRHHKVRVIAVVPHHPIRG